MDIEMARSAHLYCSFCRKDQRHVKKLVGGPGVYICDACVELCKRVLKGKSTPGFAGWDTLTDEDLLRTLPAAEEVVKRARDVLDGHVDMLRKRGVSWERIGAALGVSRQAACERFTRDH